MKKIMMMAVALFVIASMNSMAEDAPEPKELTTLKNSYNTQVKTALTPINQKYLQSLEALKKQLGGKGDISSATTVQKEIDRMNGKETVSEEVAGNEPADKPEADDSNTKPVKGNLFKEDGVVRLVAEFSDKVYEMKDGRIPDELKVKATSGGFRISGKKKIDSMTIDRSLVGHFGKGALFPAVACGGQIDAVVPIKTSDVRYFVISSATGDKSLLQEIFPKGKSAWTISKVKGDWQFQMGDQVIPFPNKTSKVGFGATLRNAGSEADLIITFK